MTSEFLMGWLLGMGFGLIGGLLFSYILLKPMINRINFKIEKLKMDLRDLEMKLKINERREQKLKW